MNWSRRIVKLYQSCDKTKALPPHVLLKYKIECHRRTVFKFYRNWEKIEFLLQFIIYIICVDAIFKSTYFFFLFCSIDYIFVLLGTWSNVTSLVWYFSAKSEVCNSLK